MFTGIVEYVGRVASSVRTLTGLRIAIDPGAWGFHPTVGDSIAVDGCCLTLAAPWESPRRELVFDVIPETLAKTTLSTWAIGRAVNLEQAATASTLLGGHVVQGHVDGVGVVRAVADREGTDSAVHVPGGASGGAWDGGHRITIGVDRELLQYLVPKGSVAVNGVSLTLATIRVEAAEFEVAIIPTTLTKTTLGGLRAGDRVNLEADAMAKTVVHYLRHFSTAFPTTPPTPTRPAN